MISKEQFDQELKGIIEFKIKNHKVRVQKQHKFSQDFIEKAILSKVKSPNITYKNITEIELQEGFKKNYNQLKKDLNELFILINSK